MARPEASLSRGDVAELERLLRRRLAGEPAAYVVGTREFWSLALEVGPAVLIPRPDTETLVERALATLAGDVDGLVLEVGTGSGAVAIAIARERPNPVVATDLHANALAVAARNAARHLAPARIAFARGDWLDAVGDARVALLVSNPPYLAADDPHLPDLVAEPRAALVAADDGLAALERLVAEGPRVVRPGGHVLLEHGFEQGASVRASFARHGYADIVTHRDLAGHGRVTAGRVSRADSCCRASRSAPSAH